MKGNLMNTLDRYGPKIKDFYLKMRECDTDLFLFRKCYVVALQDRERMYNRDGSVKINEKDIYELSSIFNVSENYIKDYMKNNELKPLVEIYAVENAAFRDKGISEICLNGKFMLPSNMIDAYRMND